MDLRGGEKFTKMPSAVKSVNPANRRLWGGGGLLPPLTYQIAGVLETPTPLCFEILMTPASRLNPDRNAFPRQSRRDAIASREMDWQKL